MLKKRRPVGHIFFNMGLSILVKGCVYIETGSCLLVIFLYYCYGKLHVNEKWPVGRLFFNMGLSILVKGCLYIETGPCLLVIIQWILAEATRVIALKIPWLQGNFNDTAVTNNEIVFISQVTSDRPNVRSFHKGLTALKLNQNQNLLCGSLIYYAGYTNIIMVTDASEPGRRRAISGHNGVSCSV